MKILAKVQKFEEIEIEISDDFYDVELSADNGLSIPYERIADLGDELMDIVDNDDSNVAYILSAKTKAGNFIAEWA